MESALLGLVLDSSVLIAAERKHQIVEQLLTSIRQTFGEVEVLISAVSLAELAHGVARATTPEVKARRRAFLDDLKKHVPVQPVTADAAETAGQLGGEQAARGVIVPIDDLLIGASAVEQGYAAATLNHRHLGMIPGLRVVPA